MLQKCDVIEVYMDCDKNTKYPARKIHKAAGQVTHSTTGKHFYQQYPWVKYVVH